MAKRVFQGLVLFFAIYAFAFVPLGKKTALEHVRAIAGTPQAQQAAAELKGGAERLVRRLRSEAEQATRAADTTSEAPESADVGSTSPTPRQPAGARERASSPRRPVRLPNHDQAAGADVTDPSQLPMPSLDELEGALPSPGAAAVKR